jgi:hexokinase
VILGGCLIFFTTLLNTYERKPRTIMADFTSSPTETDTVQKAISLFTTCINKTTLLNLATRFSETYSTLAKTSLEQFLVTPVTVLPTGKETGSFISIDVGGSNLRVGFVELLGEIEQGAVDDDDGKEANEKIRRSYDKS